MGRNGCFKKHHTELIMIGDMAHEHRLLSAISSPAEPRASDARSPGSMLFQEIAPLTILLLPITGETEHPIRASVKD